MNTGGNDLENFIWHYSRSQLKILGFIQMLVPSTVDAEDILQETSIILMNKWPEFDQSRDFTNWACGVARFEAFKHLRKQKKHTGISLDILRELGELAFERQAQQDDQQQQDALAKCFESLPTHNQTLLKERYRSNLPVSELAKLRSRTERSIYKNLTKIRETLQNCIRRRLSEVPA